MVNFPVSLDTLTNPTSSSSTIGHADLHSKVNDIVEALMAKVGIDNSNDTSSIDYKIKALQNIFVGDPFMLKSGGIFTGKVIHNFAGDQLELQNTGVTQWMLNKVAAGNIYLYRYVGGTQQPGRIYISNSNGYVGIGHPLSAPSEMLDVNGKVKGNVFIGSVKQDTSHTTNVIMNVDSYNEYDITAQAGALLFSNPTGTPVNGQKLLVRIKDNGTARALTYDTQFASGSGTLPSTTIISKKMWIGFEWDSTDNKWYCIASGSQP